MNGRERIPVVLISNFFEPGHARRVADASGARLVILPPSIEGVDGLDDPLKFFDYVVDTLGEAPPREEPR